MGPGSRFAWPGRRGFCTRVLNSVFKQPRWFSDRHCEPTGRANARPMTGSSGVSSTPRFFASITHASGILGRPVKPGDDGLECGAFVFTTNLRDLAARWARVVHEAFALKKTRAWGMPGAQCTRSLVCDENKAHERSHHRFTGETRHSRTQWFYGLLRALPGDQALLSPSSANMVRQDPVGFAHLRET